MLRATLLTLVLVAESDIRVGERLPRALASESELRDRTVLLIGSSVDADTRDRLKQVDITVADKGQALGDTTVLVEDGVVRRVIPRGKIADEVFAWRKGQGLYQDLCARCHGKDGADTSYSGIKPLAGIGRRISEAEIDRRVGRTGTVDLSRLSQDDRRALASYVAGL